MNEKIRALIGQPKTKKYALRFLIALVIFGILGFFALPPLVKSVLTDKLSVALHRNVSIEKVSINPYALTARIDTLAINEKESEAIFFSFDKLYLDLALSSIFRGGPVVKEIRLENPKFNIVRQADHQYNFSDLIDEFATKPDTETPPKQSLFSLNNIQITGGQIQFHDQPVNEEHLVSDIAITLPFVSNMAYALDTFVEPSFFARVNGAPIQVNGKSKPFANSLESEFSFELEKLELAKYADYIPTKIPLKILSGELDTNLKVTFHQEVDKPSTLIISGTTSLRNLDLKNAQGAPLASLKTLDLAIHAADLTNERIVIDRVSLDSPKLTLQVSSEGTLNWLDTFVQNNSNGSGAKAAPAKTPSWSVGEIKIANGALIWKDDSRKKEFNASVEAIELGVQKLSSDAAEPARFNVSWRAAAQEWLNIDSFSVEGGKLNFAAREVSIDKMQVKNVKGLVRRAKDGVIEWIEPPALRIVEASQNKAPEPWKIWITGYTGENIAMRFEDQTVNPAAVQNIEGLSFTAENLSTDLAQTTQITTNFRVNKRGTVAVNGTVTPAPIKVALDIDAKTLELLPFQPYFAEKLNVALKRGVLTMKGELNLAEASEHSKKEEKSARNLSGRFNGQITLGDVQLTDKVNSADFLRWKSFHVGNIDARYGPESLSISDIALTDFFARVIVTPEGKLNLLQMVRKDNQKVESITAVQPEADTKVADAGPVESGENKASVPVITPEKKELMPIKIGKVTLQGGEIRFTDNFVKPNYSANLKQIGGSITGLSSDQGSVANLELRGNFDTIAPLNITAKINPLSVKPYLDLQAEIKDVELSALSSYSGKYAGYAIEKGKLSLAVNYKIENDQLEAQNKLFLDQLTFGEPVDSPDATKLPVTLAVSLLKNRRGEIDLNIPISGSLNDPQFSIGGVVVKIIVNLLAKAITSPFALIGSMFGSAGEELSTVEFDYGYARLSPEMEKRMENLSKALIDRPEVKLEIEGYADVERDAEGAKHVRMERKVRAMKRKEIKDNEEENDTTGRSVEVTPEEYPALLEQVYKEEKFPKPRNFIGLVKGLPVEEMEKLILANSVIDENDLKGLADRRAKVVRDWLVAHEVPAERIFLLPGKIVKAEAEDNGKKASRVEFKIK